MTGTQLTFYLGWYKLLAVLKLDAGSVNQTEVGSRDPLQQPAPVGDVPREVRNWHFTAKRSESEAATVPFGSGGAPPFPNQE